MFFDLHSDILYDIVRKRLEGKRNIIKEYHLNYLEKGGFIGGIWCYYTDVEHPLCSFDQAIQIILEEVALARDVINIVLKKEDYVTDKLNVILGLEGLAYVRDLSHFKTLYDNGFRHAMLTWNEGNRYATGVCGDISSGLTQHGIEIINFMEEHQMIIDVSHANVKTFNDILRITKKPILASHSNVYPVHPHDRNLERNQLKKLIEQNGLIGLTPVSSFIGNPPVQLSDFINHLAYINAIDGLSQVGFGFDFMYYLDEDLNLKDLSYPIDTARFELELRMDYDEEAIKKLTHQNALDFINRVL